MIEVTSSSPNDALGLGGNLPDRTAQLVQIWSSGASPDGIVLAVTQAIWEELRPSAVVTLKRRDAFHPVEILGQQRRSSISPPLVRGGLLDGRGDAIFHEVRELTVATTASGTSALRESLHDLNLGSMVAVPIELESEASAIVVVGFREPQRPSVRETAFLEQLSRVARALNRATRQRSVTSEQIRQQRGLAELARNVAGCSDFSHFGADAFRTVTSLVPADWMLLTALEAREPAGSSDGVVCWSLPKAELREHLALEGSATAELMRRGEPMILTVNNDVRLVPEFDGSLPDRASVVGAPLVHLGQPFGMVALARDAAAPYDRHDLALLSQIASQLAGAVHITAVMQHLRRSLYEQFLHDNLAKTAWRVQDLTTLFEQTHATLRLMVPIDRIAVALFDEAAGKLRYQFVRGVELPQLCEGDWVGAVDGRDEWQPWTHSLEPSCGSDFINVNEGRTERVRSGPALLSARIETPLIAGNGNPLGVLVVRSRAENAYRARDLELLGEVAAAIGPAVESIQRVQRLQAELADRVRVSEVARRMREQERPADLYSAFGSGARSIIAFDDLAVELVDAARLQTFPEWVKDRGSDADSPRSLISPAVLQSMIDHARPQIADDSHLPEGFSPQDVRQLLMVDGAFLSALVVPVVNLGVVTAAVVFRAQRRCAFTRREERFADQICAHLASVCSMRLEQVLGSSSRMTSEDSNGATVDPLVALELTRVDLQILQAVVAGQHTQEIAKSLHFAPGTVRNRLARIYRVLGVSDRAGAVSAAIRSGLIK